MIVLDKRVVAKSDVAEKVTDQEKSTKQRKIIHVDMDCFYAAVEMRDNPDYRDRPLAVGGKERQRGIISTCNYQAREFGVRSAMPTGQAIKLCPQLLVVPGRMQVYVSVSGQIREIFQRYTQLIEPLSLDEAFLDVTDCEKLHGSATLIAEAIRRDIWQELHLTASAGVAPIKFLAKVASDMNKPNGQFVIPPEEVQKVVDKLPLEKIPGVGKVGLEKLHQAGYFICEDIKNSDYRELLLQFGRLGASLWNKSHGIDHRSVEPERERKSVGVERTFSQNIATYQQCWQVITDTLYPELDKRLAKVDANKRIVKQGIKVKFADFQHFPNAPIIADFLSINRSTVPKLIECSASLQTHSETKSIHHKEIATCFLAAT